MSEFQVRGLDTDPSVHLLPQSGLASPGPTVSDLLNEAPTSKFHRRAVLISGMGFFTDAYDLFVIATVATLVKTQWHLSTTQASWVTGSAILAAFFGAMIFGRIADVIGRKSIYVLVAVIMIIGAVTSALAPSFWVPRDRPVRARSRHWRRLSRLGRFDERIRKPQGPWSPGRARVLHASGRTHRRTPGGTRPAVVRDQREPDVEIAPRARSAASRRGGLPRSRMPESPRFKAKVRGEVREAAERTRDLLRRSHPHQLDGWGNHPSRCAFGAVLHQPRMLRLIIGTAGAWFLFDYAYYGNTLSLPSILKEVSPHATLEQKLAWSLGIFVVFAVPGYLLAVVKMDRIGHRRLQFIGFAVMALCFLALGIFPALTTTVVPFLLVFGLSYFFVEFGPNTTTFVLPSEVFPVNMRTTGHGTAAGIGKLGAFIGVFLVPQLQQHIQLRGMLLVAGGAAILGFVLTGLLPEPALKSLEEMSGEEGADFDRFSLEIRQMAWRRSSNALSRPARLSPVHVELPKSDPPLSCEQGVPVT